MTEANSDSTLILPALLFDGTGSSAKTDQAVLIADGAISAVGDSGRIVASAPPSSETIELGSACLTPGLIDGHTHLSLAGDDRDYIGQFADSDEVMVLTGAMNMCKHLAAGITSIREHGARNMVGFALKEGWSRGYIPGPTMLVSGRPLTCTGGHFHMCNEVADGEAEIRKSVRRLVHDGADYIKIMASGGGTIGTEPGVASYSQEELHAAVHEAANFGRVTAAHCRARESMLRAVKAGIHLIEHAEFLDPEMNYSFDPKLAEMMVDSGVWVSPTIQASISYQRSLQLEQLREANQLTSAQAVELDELLDKRTRRLEVLRRMLEYDLRERIVPGTDSGVRNLAFGHMDFELRLLVEVGFTPAEALKAATAIAATAVGLNDRGTIEPGKVADLAAFEGDPTKDIEALSQVVAVFQAGRRVH